VSTRPKELPPDVEAARCALLDAIDADPTGGAGCEPLAAAFGRACREAKLPGSTVYRALSVTLGYTPRLGRLDAPLAPVTLREQLMLVATDAFYQTARHAVKR
jgi:hypothetical protein